MRRVIFALTILIAGYFSYAAPRPAFAQDGEALWLFNQINALRQSKGLHTLGYNALLAVAAYNHSVYLSTNDWTDAHTESNGSTPRTRALAAGYPVKYIGENVVGGGKRTAESAFNWWMNSSIHYQNMLGTAYLEIGVGIAEGPRGTYYTLVFGAQDGSSAPPPQQPPVQAQEQAQAPAANQPAKAPPTRVPTRRPTLTPTNTLTPTITYTPRATFTPTFTGTPLPASPTPIVLEVSPQPTEGPQLVAMVSTPLEGQTFVAGSVIETPRSNDLLRTLIPLAIALQIMVIGGAVVRNVIQRRK